MATPSDGIYLQVSSGSLGTGHTQKQKMTFKNHYCVRVTGDVAELFLLDDGMDLTGLREEIHSGELVGGEYQYQPQLQDRYEALRTKLGQPPARPQRPAPQPAAPAAAAAPAAKPAAKPAAAANPFGGGGDGEESPWWEMTQRGSRDLLKK